MYYDRKCRILQKKQNYTEDIKMLREMAKVNVNVEFVVLDKD